MLLDDIIAILSDSKGSPTDALLKTTDHLRHGSEILEKLIQKDGLQVIGAEYSLDSGIVEFFDGVLLPRIRCRESTIPLLAII